MSKNGVPEVKATAGINELNLAINEARTINDLDKWVLDVDRVVNRAVVFGNLGFAYRLRAVREKTRNTYDEQLLQQIEKAEDSVEALKFRKTIADFSQLVSFRDQMIELLKFESGADAGDFRAAAGSLSDDIKRISQNDPALFWDNLKAISPELLGLLKTLFPSIAEILRKGLAHEIVAAAKHGEDIDPQKVIAGIQTTAKPLQ